MSYLLWGVYFQRIRFSRVLNRVDEFNACNKCLTAKLQSQGYRYQKFRKDIFSKFYLRHHELVSKFDVGLKSLLYLGLSEPELQGNLVYKFQNIMVMTYFSDQLRTFWTQFKCHATVCILNDLP